MLYDCTVKALYNKIQGTTIHFHYREITLLGKLVNLPFFLYLLSNYTAKQDKENKIGVYLKLFSK